MPQIKKAKIKRISLCPRGANQMPVLYKSEDNSVSFDPLIKADIDQGLLTSIVYVPNRPDSQGDWASAETIEKMAHDFLTDHEGINIRHGNTVLTKEQAKVVESFIVQKGDPRFTDIKDYSGQPVDVTGAWAAVIKIDDDELRQAYREGKWNGVSMEGPALLDAAKQEDEASLIGKFANMLKSLLGQDSNSQEGELDMKPEDVQKMIDDSATKTMDGVKGLLKEAGLIKDKDKSEQNDISTTVAKSDTIEAPVFKGDMSNEDDRKAHRKALAIYKAKTTIKDPVEQFDAIEKIEKEFAENTDELDKAAGVEKEDTAEVKDLKRKLHKAQRSSNQSTTDNTVAKSDEDDSGMTFLSKDQRDLVSDAQKAAKAFNGDTE